MRLVGRDVDRDDRAAVDLPGAHARIGSDRRGGAALGRVAAAAAPLARRADAAPAARARARRGAAARRATAAARRDAARGAARGARRAGGAGGGGGCLRYGGGRARAAGATTACARARRRRAPGGAGARAAVLRRQSTGTEGDERADQAHEETMRGAMTTGKHGGPYPLGHTASIDATSRSAAPRRGQHCNTGTCASVQTVPTSAVARAMLRCAATCDPTTCGRRRR